MPACIFNFLSLFIPNTQNRKKNKKKTEKGISQEKLFKDVSKEFENAKEMLIKNGINVITASEGKQDTPDCMFPNNWLTTHSNGTAITYPMKIPNRRNEIREDILEMLKNKGYIYNNIQRWEKQDYIDQNMFLEGTGAYNMCLSLCV